MGDRAIQELDVVVVGGGLQSCLLVHALRHHQPNKRIAVVEASADLAGNHTWCLHRGDVSAAIWRWLEPLAHHQWQGYQVKFAHMERRVSLAYAALTARHVAESTRRVLEQGAHTLRLSCRALEVGKHHVKLEDGSEWRAPLLVDARGPQGRAPSTSQGWQKFVGIEVHTAVDHDVAEPILMDATVRQDDGLRFQYVLPLGPRTLLIEETCFSDNPDLDVAEYVQCCHRYAADRGWAVTAEERRECGVLPMPWAWQAVETSRLVGGVQGSWFHPLTGYSLAEAAGFAEWLAASATPPTQAALAARYADLRRRGRLARWLCRALFRHCDPGDRAAMLERFYRRTDAVIGRFYAMQSTPGDAWRIVAGAPPRGMRWWPRPLATLTSDESASTALAALAAPEGP